MLIYEYMHRSLKYGVLFGPSALESEGCMPLRNPEKIPATQSHSNKHELWICPLFVTKPRTANLQCNMDMRSRILTLAYSFWHLETRVTSEQEKYCALVPVWRGKMDMFIDCSFIKPRRRDLVVTFIDFIFQYVQRVIIQKRCVYHIVLY
jgi:hypothetical protein